MVEGQLYSVIKDSGLFSVNEIPDAWSIRRIKYVAELDPSCKPNNIPLDSLVSFAPMECVRNGVRIPRVALLSQGGGTYSSFRDGDIAIAKVTPCFEKGNCVVMENLKNGYCFGSSELFNLRPQNVNTKFLFYSLQTPCFVFGAVSTMTGVGGLQRVSSFYMKNAKIPFPPLQEQQAIADYLDKKCASIDSIVAKTKQTIADYKSYKASLIYEAVTKGLNPDVAMKDSGVEWIGEIPESWVINKLKHLVLAPLQYGANESGVAYSPDLPRYIRITDITSEGKLKTEGMLSLPKDVATPYILHKKDILLARSGATVGKAFLFEEDIPAAFAGYLIRAVIDETKAIPKFIYYNTIGAGYQNWKESVLIQATIQNIGANRYNDFLVAVPPLPEQQAITDYLDKKCASIDTLIAKKEALVADIEAYKKSLIYECVTGKRSVS